ncbi:cyclin B1 interacting protein 1, E3 ubiquitin protein ligase, variant 3 [Balamuthia mandrillaris]
MTSACKCNICWKDLGEYAYITTCSHIFCEEDARKHFESESSCPVCDTPLPSRGVAAVELAPTIDKAIQLCGLPPGSIMELSTKALQFWDYQKQAELNYKAQIFKEQQARSQALEQQYHEKLVQAQNKLNVLNHQLSATKDELSAQRKAFEELQEKYQEKSRQKRKLAELYDSLKQRHEALAGDNKRATASPAMHTSSPLLRSPVRKTGLLSSEPPNRSFQFLHHGQQSSMESSAIKPITAGFSSIGFGTEKRDTGSVAPNLKPKELDRFSLVRRHSPKGNMKVTVPKIPQPTFSFSRPVRPETPLFRKHLQSRR